MLSNITECVCQANFLLNANETACLSCSGPGSSLDVNDLCICSALNSTLNANQNQCVCDDGFRASDDGLTCVDIDECETNTATCDTKSEVCLNTVGSFTCDCDANFTIVDNVCKRDCHYGTIRHSNNYECIECSGPGATLENNLCSCSAANSTIYDNTCVCDNGYEESQDGHSCQDKDECASEDSYCDENASCRNTHGSFLCNCDQGFIGNGTICQDKGSIGIVCT